MQLLTTALARNVSPFSLPRCIALIDFPEHHLSESFFDRAAPVAVRGAHDGEAALFARREELAATACRARPIWSRRPTILRAAPGRAAFVGLSGERNRIVKVGCEPRFHRGAARPCRDRLVEGARSATPRHSDP